MDEAIRRLRSKARQLARGKIPRAIRYPAAFREAAVAVTRDHLNQGMVVSRAARELGLPTRSLVRWLETPTRPDEVAGLRQTTPGGYRREAP